MVCRFVRQTSVAWLCLGLTSVLVSLVPVYELARAAYQSSAPIPQISEIAVGSRTFTPDQKAAITVRVGDTVILTGSGFGSGPDIDYSKIMVGKGRVLERDLPMYEGKIDIFQRLFFETSHRFDFWPKDIVSWSDNRIEFRVPVTATTGSLVVQIQKRMIANQGLTTSTPHKVIDPLTERITREPFQHVYGDVSLLTSGVQTAPVAVQVINPQGAARIARGEAIFWSYDFNMGLAHSSNGLDWTAIFRNTTTPWGTHGDVRKLFGAIPLAAGDVPEVARAAHDFDPYPNPSPLKYILFQTYLTKGRTQPTGYVGYVYAESLNPIWGWKESHIGFNCASCHTNLITYEASPGHTVSKVFPGIPNPKWTMKWNVLNGKMNGVIDDEERGPDGKVAPTDKTNMIWSIPGGMGEISIVRHQHDPFPYGNDQLFTPIAIPIITRHLPVRRALSRTELIAGFEGSYIHAEEPDGALGAMGASALKDLTAYMSTLDENDTTLERVGMYRWLKDKSWLDLIDRVSEGTFHQTGKESYPRLMARIANGERAYREACGTCHESNFGTNTDENMFRLSDVGTFFSPTSFHRQTQSIRTSIIRNLYWVAQRGLLHDGHVRTLEDLVDPDRVTRGTDLYNDYYTMHPGSFHIRKGTPEQERALRNHAYFSEVWWDEDSLYWDYQKMWRSFGKREFASRTPIRIPDAPHPWPARAKEDVDDLVLYLLTL
jgi:hypothetical protein